MAISHNVCRCGEPGLLVGKSLAVSSPAAPRLQNTKRRPRSCCIIPAHSLIRIDFRFLATNFFSNLACYQEKVNERRTRCSWLARLKPHQERLFIYDTNQQEVDQVEVTSAETTVINGWKLQFDKEYVFQIGNAKAFCKLTSTSEFLRINKLVLNFTIILM